MLGRPPQQQQQDAPPPVESIRLPAAVSPAPDGGGGGDGRPPPPPVFAAQQAVAVGAAAYMSTTLGPPSRATPAATAMQPNATGVGPGGMPPLYYNNATTSVGIVNNTANQNNNPQNATNISNQQQQQQQQELLGLVPSSAVSTPWTLGSTDGSFAVQLAMLEQQRQQQAQAHQRSPTTSTANTTGPTNSSQSLSSNNNIQQHHHQKMGAAITSSGEAASKSTVSSNASENSSIRSPVHVNNNGGGGGGSGGGASVSTAESSIIQQQRLHQERMAALTAKRSLFQARLFKQPSSSVESVLAASCEVMGFDIAEMWLRTGAKTHQLTNSHLRPTALEDSVRDDLVDVYYGEKSSERTHRLSPALCKRAKEANDVVWVTAHTSHGVEALRCSISNVRTAAAVPICHEASNTNITIIFFSIRRIIVRPTSVEFLVHMALASGVAAVNSLAEDGLLDRGSGALDSRTINDHRGSNSHSEHIAHVNNSNSISIRHQRLDRFSVTGAQLDLQWRELHNVEYLTDGGNSWIHTAVFNGKPVVVKTLKPECQDVALAINEIEGELSVHSRLSHPNIVDLMGAGTTSKGVRFVVLERLDGGTLSQRLGYDNRIRDRRRRFWRKKHFSYLDVLRIARSIAEAMTHCHEQAIPGSVVLHRDLKPDNIGFTLDGTVKILDFGLAKIVENASVNANDVYTMSGETGSLRYMAPEVADALPYNHMADVYSFGIILWELNAGKKPFDGLNREMFYERVVHGGERPPLHRKWPSELTDLMSECWDADMTNRPKFRDIVERLDEMLSQEKGGSATKKKKNQFLPRLSGMIDRHSTWF